MQLENLAAVAAVHRRTGVRRLVLSGVLEEAALRDRYRAAVAMPLAVVRLRLDLGLVQQRLVRRHADDDDERVWHLARSAELHTVLDR